MEKIQTNRKIDNQAITKDSKVLCIIYSTLFIAITQRDKVDKQKKTQKHGQTENIREFSI